MSKLSSILLVDDDPTTNFLNERLLRKMAVADQLLLAGSGQEALRLLGPATTMPNLLLLDINMPDMSGLDFLEAYEQLPMAETADTVVVVLTALAHQRDLERLDGLPIAGVLNKPLTRDKVEVLLHQHFPEA